MEPVLRISNSPRRSPQLTQGLESPARSVYPSMQQMDSMYLPPDDGLRNTDFFDDTSDDELGKTGATKDAVIEDNLFERRGTASRIRHLDLPLEPFASQCDETITDHGRRISAGYRPLTPSVAPEDNRLTAQTPSSSLVGSVDELLPTHRSSPPDIPMRPRDADNRDHRQSSARVERSTDRSSKLDQKVDAYAIAHDITLQALIRNGDILDRSQQSFLSAPLPNNQRQSLHPTQLLPNSDPTGSQVRHISSPPTEGKKAHVIPPPINTSAARRSLPDHLVRTPYPFTPDPVRHKDITKGAAPAIGSAVPSTVESVLTLSIRQSNPNSRRRITSLTIPAANDFSVIRSHSPRAKEQHFRALDFDDTAFFLRLRQCYAKLIGPWRFLSARSLQRIIVSGSAMKEANRGYWIYEPRSPRTLAYKGLKDSFSEEKILQHYRNPRLGKSRYAFVHWAHRLAAAPPARATSAGEIVDDNDAGELVRRMEQPEGLEFVVSWSLIRISVALAIVLIVATAAALLWIFLGLNTASSSPNHGGYRDAGDRITSGVVMGICLLLLGLSGIAGWLTASWLAM